MFSIRALFFALVLTLALCVAAVPTGQKRALKQATIARRQPGAENAPVRRAPAPSKRLAARAPMPSKRLVAKPADVARGLDLN
ncbi:hypothetical protein PENSPDRAFT_685305 [Peniophora sp. CONT]|nr:hypothetical protein PENSPDRAFT_685305 [Peniophora sp. CONT]